MSKQIMIDANNKDKVDISIVVPVYKEESNISPFLKRIEAVMLKMAVTYEIIFALDPSPDKTEQVILKEIERNPNIKLLVFSRRFGQPAATMGGINASVGENIVLIDVDLQDPPEIIEDMYQVISTGVDVVYAKRKSRSGETLLKKSIAKLGYFLIDKLSDVQIPRNVGEFRMMSRRVVNELISLKESHGFIRGLVAFIGFQQVAIEFDRDARVFEEGKYNRFTGSIKIGINGLVGFGSRPLQIMSMFGFIISGFSFLIGLVFAGLKLYGYPFVPGQAAIILFISFFSGVQLIGMGIMGEYIGRIYDEVKHRPQYIVDKRINFGEHS